ncbi:MAG TPA: CHAD domain-containing protein [Pyrinomonadaceae bacterium]
MVKAKEIAGLDCAMRAGDGIKLILRSRFEEMCSFSAAALDWSETEGVHDMRVASRRLRSVVKDFLPYLRRRKLRQAREDLRSVAQALGAVRDQDVALIALEKLAEDAPPELSTGVKQFANSRQHKRGGARSQLGEALSEDALKKLQQDFHDALEESLKGSRGANGDEQAITDDAELHEIAREILDERLRDLDEMSTSLFQPFETEHLHEMRIAAKRLRYAMELFTPCLGEALKPFCKEIARMQDSLGELHDCDVWIVEIGAALRKASDEKVAVKSPGDGLEESMLSNDSTTRESETQIEHQAVFWLLDHFVKQRTEHFCAALERWREWKTTGFQERLADTIHNQSLGVEPISSAAKIIANES